MVVKEKPELAKAEPFNTVLSGDREAIAKLTMDDLSKILAATLTGNTELTYLPMIELLKYLRANGYRTHIVTGGGQDFVRVYSEEVYGIVPEQVVGTMGGTKYGYDKEGKPFLTKEHKLLLNDAGKPDCLHLMIERRPYAAFGNSTKHRRSVDRFFVRFPSRRIHPTQFEEGERPRARVSCQTNLPDFSAAHWQCSNSSEGCVSTR